MAAFPGPQPRSAPPFPQSPPLPMLGPSPSPSPLLSWCADSVSTEPSQSCCSRTDHQGLGQGAAEWGRGQARSQRARLRGCHRLGRAGALTPMKNSWGGWWACGRCWQEEGESGSQRSTHSRLARGKSWLLHSAVWKVEENAECNRKNDSQGLSCLGSPP